MLSKDERMAIMRARLQQAFSPTMLEIIDDSAKHQGHAGAKSGAGHYTLVIQAPCFQNQSRVDIHRQIYQVLHDLIPHEIHALAVKISS